MKVLITTSGVGSRLGELTKFTNKSLIRVGRKPAISYIIETYPSDTEFVITTGYYGDQVKEFLSLAYPNHKFIFVDVSPYEGKGSSLGYSMLCAEKYLQEPFIFNACDTIIDKKIFSIDNSWLGGSRKGSSSQYRTFSVIGNKVNSIHEKGEKNYDFEYLGICAIQDWERFWCMLNELYVQYPDNTSLSDCDALRECINSGNDFGYREFSWLDIGNLDSLNEARNKVFDHFDLLDKVDESIFLFDKFVIKFFFNEEICQNRVRRASLLSGKVPDILGYTKHFYKYELADGYLFSEVANTENFKMLLQWSKNNLWIVRGEKSKVFYDTCKKFYFDKTISRINKFHKDNNIKDQIHLINGLSIPTINELISNIDEDLMCNIDPRGFHGDFILDNMLLNGNEIKLLDWRQDFGGNIELGDIYYDLGKLNHNLVINHSIIHSGGYKVEFNGNNITIDILRKNTLIECQNVLYDFCIKHGYNVRKVKLISAIIWLNMAPLHDKNFGLFLYLFGKYNLYKALC
jgi:choline kinase